MQLDFSEVIKTRRSIRRYKPDPVPDEMVRQLIDIPRHAPSADNTQPWEFIIVKDRQLKKRLSQTYAWSHFIKDASLCIVALGNQGRSPSYFAIDTTCAIQNLLRATHWLGLGACWVAVYDPYNPSYEKHVRAVKYTFAPQSYRMIPIGYPNDKAAPKNLRQIEEVLHYDVYRQQR